MKVFPRRLSHALTVICSALFVFALPGAASAQTRNRLPAGQTTTVIDPGHWTVTPFIGIGFSGDLDSPTGAFGAAAGYVWTERVTLEGELNILPSSEVNGLVEVDNKVWSLTGNVVYHFTGRQWIPYGVFGIGFGHGSVDVDNPSLSQLSTSSTEFVVNFGGGVERRLTERLAFRGDLRYFFGGDLVPDYWRLAAGLSIDLGRR